MRYVPQHVAVHDIAQDGGVCSKGRGVGRVAVHNMFLIQQRMGKKKEIQLYRIWKFESDNKSVSY